MAVNLFLSLYLAETESWPNLKIYRLSGFIAIYCGDNIFITNYCQVFC